MASKQDTDYILGAIHKLRKASRGHLAFQFKFFINIYLCLNTNK